MTAEEIQAWAEYIPWTETTIVSDASNGIEHLRAGILEEFGEVLAAHYGTQKRIARGDTPEQIEAVRAKVLGEVGDLAWYVARLCGVMGVNPRYVLIQGISGHLQRLMYSHDPVEMTEFGLGLLLCILDLTGVSLVAAIDSNKVKLSARKEQGLLMGVGER